MIATITITPESNIDYAVMQVISLSNVRKVSYHWDENVIVHDLYTNETDTVSVSSLSLYKHRLVIDGIRHRILTMLSK